MHYQIIACASRFGMVRRSSCLIQRLSEVRLYRLKLSNQNLNSSFAEF